MPIDFNRNSGISFGNYDVPASTDQFTMMLWARLDFASNGSSGDQFIFGKANGTGTNNTWWSFQAARRGVALSRLRIGNSTTEISSPQSYYIEGDNVHFALVYDGSQVRFYGDGVLIGSANRSGNVATSASVPVGMAALPSSTGSRRWAGVAADVRIYTRAFTVEEINQVMLMTGKDYFYDNLYVHYKLDEQPVGNSIAAGPSIKDSGFNKFDGTRLNTSALYSEVGLGIVYGRRRA